MTLLKSLGIKSVHHHSVKGLKYVKDYVNIIIILFNASSSSVLRPYISSFSFLLGDMTPMHSIYIDLSLLILFL